MTCFFSPQFVGTYISDGKYTVTESSSKQQPAYLYNELLLIPNQPTLNTWSLENDTGRSNLVTKAFEIPSINNISL